MEYSQQNGIPESSAGSQRKYNLRPYKKAKWKDLIEVACDQRNSTKKSTGLENNKVESEPEPQSSSEDAGYIVIFLFEFCFGFFFSNF